MRHGVWFKSWSAIVLGFLAVICANGCGPRHEEATHLADDASKDGESRNDGAVGDHNKVVLLFRQEEGVQDERVVSILRAVRLAAGDQVVIDLETASATTSGSSGPLEIWLSPQSTNSMKTLIRLIETLRDSGISRVKVVTNAGSDIVNCDVYTTVDASRECVTGHRDHVRFYYAHWDATSELAIATVLCDLDLWVAVTKGRMPLVLLDSTKTSPELSDDVKWATGHQSIPTFAVMKYRSGDWRNDAFSVIVDRHKLFTAIRVAADERRVQESDRPKQPFP